MLAFFVEDSLEQGIRFLIFCMFYLQLINMKCAKEKTSISNVIPEPKKNPSLYSLYNIDFN